MSSIASFCNNKDSISIFRMVRKNKGVNLEARSHEESPGIMCPSHFTCVNKQHRAQYSGSTCCQFLASTKISSLCITLNESALSAISEICMCP